MLFPSPTLDKADPWGDNVDDSSAQGWSPFYQNSYPVPVFQEGNFLDMQTGKPASFEAFLEQSVMGSSSLGQNFLEQSCSGFALNPSQGMDCPPGLCLDKLCPPAPLMPEQSKIAVVGAAATSAALPADEACLLSTGAPAEAQPEGLYTPGKQLASSATFGFAASPLTLFPLDHQAQGQKQNQGQGQVQGNSLCAGTGGGRPGGRSSPLPTDQDLGSECSTADTVRRGPASPDRLSDVDGIGSTAAAVPALPALLEPPPGLSGPEATANTAFSGEEDLATPHAGPVFRLALAEALPESELGSPDMPSIGSAGHRLAKCKPCAFNNTKGCASGVDCKFCHICEPGEKKRRQKVKKSLASAMTELQQASVAAGWPFSSSAVP